MHIEDAVLWVDMHNPTHEEEKEILEGYFNFHPLAVEDCADISTSGRKEHFPKAEDYGAYIFVIFNPIAFDKLDKVDLRYSTQQLSAFVGKQFLVTHHMQYLEAIDLILRRCDVHDTMMSRGSDYLFHLIVDAIVDSYVPLVEQFDDLLDDIEERIFRDYSSVSLEGILSMKKNIMRMRNLMIHQREVLNRLARGDFELISEHESFYYRNVYDHLVRMAELMEGYRDVIGGILEAYLTVNANRMNQVMKILTIISTIFLPLTFISSIYGMNFDFMPELHWDIGYPLVWMIFVVVGTTMFFWMKGKGWLQN